MMGYTIPADLRLLSLYHFLPSLWIHDLQNFFICFLVNLFFYDECVHNFPSPHIFVDLNEVL